MKAGRDWKSNLMQQVPARGHGGFSLVELMVAMVLGLFILGGVLSVFLATSQSYGTNQALSEVQSNARIAYELLARDIRQAGATGCDKSGNVASVIKHTAATPQWWADWTNTLHGYDDADADPAVATGAGTAQRASNTDSLTLIGATGSGFSVQSSNTPAPTAANFQLSTNVNGVLQQGDIAIVCDPSQASIFQVTNDPSANIIVHNTGVGSPGNCSKGLGVPTDCSSTNGNSYTYARNATLFKLNSSDWYIGHNPAGGLSLYQIPGNGAAQEMVRGVTNMQLEFHQQGAASFVAAGTVTNWASVDAVKVTLTIESSDQKATPDAKPITRDFTTITAVRN